MKIDWGKTLTSKAIWLGVLTVAISILEFISQQPAGESILTLAIGILIIIVRFLTKDPITK
jgi:hypothetical protein